VAAPEGATITRHGDDVAIVCNQSLEVFYVTCSADDVWVGELGNCTRIGNDQVHRAPEMELGPGLKKPRFLKKIGF